ncbi:hypothetical protein PQ465_10665 [Sphingobacterium oryzagri]|uniref:CarboxypepD_reg-like domain-containing protein n=1 Tax=Sphingobacterium oryzagri TaxID=3025669 RepID=A0ABY7WD22_9SPHI|nr:hypothetical protein [Sphingobacterium sp. KACC 22765]WDF66765.1 hypothetical protein PQ465_10665 [Sphingobacterium sp. KACC 22765]
MKISTPLLGTLVMLLALLAPAAHAQQVKGIVHELESSQRLKDVLVKNLRTNEKTQTDSEGNFTITADINDLLSFTQAGYEIDTAFIYEEGVKRVYLVRDQKNIVIDEVVISRLTDSRLVAEIEKARNEGKTVDASQNRGGMRISPSRLFGRQSKMARNNLKMLLTEQNNRKVDRLFSNQVIRAIVPLSDTELPLFREQFRPDLDFIQTASPEDVRIYVLDAYSKFKSN